MNELHIKRVYLGMSVKGPNAGDQESQPPRRKLKFFIHNTTKKSTSLPKKMIRKVDVPSTSPSMKSPSVDKVKTKANVKANVKAKALKVNVPKDISTKDVTAQNWREKTIDTKQDKIPKTTRNDGKLKYVAPMLFQQAYGLNGFMKMKHETLILESMEKYSCSEAAMKDLLYGHSYDKEIGVFRSQIPDYARMSNISFLSLEECYSLPFANFNGLAKKDDPIGQNPIGQKSIGQNPIDQKQNPIPCADSDPEKSLDTSLSDDKKNHTEILADNTSSYDENPYHAHKFFLPPDEGWYLSLSRIPPSKTILEKLQVLCNTYNVKYNRDGINIEPNVSDVAHDLQQMHMPHLYSARIPTPYPNRIQAHPSQQLHPLHYNLIPQHMHNSMPPHPLPPHHPQHPMSNQANYTDFEFTLPPTYRPELDFSIHRAKSQHVYPPRHPVYRNIVNDSPYVPSSYFSCPSYEQVGNQATNYPSEKDGLFESQANRFMEKPQTILSVLRQHDKMAR